MPRIALIICATQRSGSVLLATALHGTGLAGKPAEYFGSRGRALFAERLGAETDADYVAAVVERATTPNGVLSAVVHWHTLENARAWLTAAYGPALPEDPFSVLAPRVQYVWLTRRDKVRQAVSDFRAHRSGAWGWMAGTPRPEPGDVSFDYEEIARLVRQYAEWDDRWRDYFAGLGVSPERIVYEDDLEAGLEHTVRRLLELLRVEIPADLVISSDLQKLADALSDQLVARYLEEDARRRRAG